MPPLNHVEYGAALRIAEPPMPFEIRRACIAEPTCSIPIGIEQVGSAMHARLISKGMGGSAMRSAAPYSTWFNGGMRTATYFRNTIGILTEIIGSPTPIQIPVIAEKQLPTTEWPLPINPQTWHYRQSIDYMMELERAVVDYASRNKDTLMTNFYFMGRRDRTS